MSSTIYNKAFELQLSHEFYTPARRYSVNQQLELLATSATSELMRKGRMRSVRTGAGLDVFFQAYLDSSPIPVIKPLVELTGEMEFVFALIIKPGDTYFLNVTDLDAGGTYESGNILLLDGTMPVGPDPTPPIGTPVNLTLTDSLIDQLRPAVFTYSFLPNPATTNNLEVKVYPEGSGTPVITINPVLINPDTGVYSVQIDLSKEPVGIYTLEAKDGVTTVHTATLYIDSELARQNVFGIVRLSYPNPDYFYNGLPDTASYEFAAREIQWRYYVAIKSVPAGFFTTHSLKIIDDNNPNPAVYTFAPLTAVPHGTVAINGLPTVIITSNQAIPFSETAIPRFKLVQNNPVNPEKQLMVALQNAATSGVDSNQVGVPGERYAEIFLFIDQVSDP